ncbi:hypothetical protein H6G89_09720 [Oscillatoria sp. FACHB-1407]|uniref:hypothetical protein n=1 Tax=Oscillatoria sp. FACHB-1407 TaxID=2692847 RepID=UPI001684D6D8|nr:hypothetical protein [Oscillatoria sp. FACHB-1407]MBD2461324.1 hypothetical protein [Oscillatoria sp. FACHB-1407]
MSLSESTEIRNSKITKAVQKGGAAPIQEFWRGVSQNACIAVARLMGQRQATPKKRGAIAPPAVKI